MRSSFCTAVKDGPASQQPRPAGGAARRRAACAHRSGPPHAAAARGPQRARRRRASPQAELPFAPPQPAASDIQASALRAQLAALDPEQLTPRAALELLFELHRLARQ